MAVNCGELHFRNLVLFCFGAKVGVKLHWRTRHFKKWGSIDPLDPAAPRPLAVIKPLTHTRKQFLIMNSKHISSLVTFTSNSAFNRLI